jgi:hypothetical protein
VACRQPLQQWAQASGELAAKLPRSVLGQQRLLAVEVDSGRPLATTRCFAVMVGDRVSGDLVHPRADRRGTLEFAGVAVDTQHDLLQNVLGAVAVPHTAGDEAQ